MGCKNLVLSEPLLRKGAITSLTFEEQTRQPYNDNLCFFRQLVLHLYGTQPLEGKTPEKQLSSSIEWMALVPINSKEST